MACRTGCPDQDCENYAQCLRRANFQVDRHALANDTRRERSKDHTLERYRQLRADGLQPPSIKKSRLDAFEKTL